MLGLMKNVLCHKDDTDIAMMTAFRKQIAHMSTGIRVTQQVIQYKFACLASRVFKINRDAFVMSDVQI